MNLIIALPIAFIIFLVRIARIILNRRSVLLLIISVELILLAVNLHFAIFSIILDDLIGQLFALLILTVAAAESAIRLALLVVYYRARGSINIEFIRLLKG
jgi:NADH-quinone oxidoreductase subunit K